MRGFRRIAIALQIFATCGYTINAQGVWWNDWWDHRHHTRECSLLWPWSNFQNFTIQLTIVGATWRSFTTTLSCSIRIIPKHSPAVHAAPIRSIRRITSASWELTFWCFPWPSQMAMANVWLITSPSKADHPSCPESAGKTPVVMFMWRPAGNFLSQSSLLQLQQTHSTVGGSCGSHKLNAYRLFEVRLKVPASAIR